MIGYKLASSVLFGKNQGSCNENFPLAICEENPSVALGYFRIVVRNLPADV